jgi:type II secretory pathway component PulJ
MARERHACPVIPRLARDNDTMAARATGTSASTAKLLAWAGVARATHFCVVVVPDVNHDACTVGDWCTGGLVAWVADSIEGAHRECNRRHKQNTFDTAADTDTGASTSDRHGYRRRHAANTHIY